MNNEQSYISLPIGITPARPTALNSKMPEFENMQHLNSTAQIFSSPSESAPIPTRDTMWIDAMKQGNLSEPPGTMAVTMTSCKAVFTKVITSKVLVSTFIFIFTIVLLLCVNPPIAQKKGEDGLPRGRSSLKIMAWALVTAFLAFFIPYLGYTPFKPHNIPQT